MIDGPKINLGGVERILAPLNFKALRKVGPRMGLLAGLKTGMGVPEEAQDLLVEMVLASLRRNYPEITQEEVEEHLDLRNVEPVVLALLNATGLVKGTAPGEAVSP